MDKPFDWNPAKNRTLQQQRGISFEDVINALNHGQLIALKNHPNQSKYPNQRIYYLIIKNYVYFVPFVEDDDKIFLKTIIPSRKAFKEYLSTKKEAR